MAANSKIEWTERTWNPIVGCSIVSPGCANCYAMRMAARLEKMLKPERRGDALLPNHYSALTKPSKAGPVWTGRVNIAPERTITEPFHRRTPTTYFVNSMGDLFHESVPDEWIDRVFAVMALCPQHVFQVLTKRAERMREYFAGDALRRVWDTTVVLDCQHHIASDKVGSFLLPSDPKNPAWPLPNIWLGVSAERQQEANERIPYLLATPAAVRFVSCEPLLGAVDLARIEVIPSRPKRSGVHVSALTGKCCESGLHYHFDWDGNDLPPQSDAAKLDWVIVGGESGSHARPMHPDWVRSIHSQCEAVGTPFFFKQWGMWGIETTTPVEAPEGSLQAQTIISSTDRKRIGETTYVAGRGEGMRADILARLGKSRAGRLLDGREWNEFPEGLS